MTEFPQLRREFISSIAERLKHYGLDKKSGDNFYRKTKQGRDYYTIQFTSYPGLCFDVTAALAVRNDALESLIDELSIYDNKYRKGVPTIYDLVGNLMQSRKHTWSITTQDDLQTAEDGLVAIFKELAPPYYERYSTLESIYEFFRPVDADSNRAVNVICTAYLLADRTEYNHVVTVNHDYLLANNKHNTDAFLLAVERLNEMWGKR